MTKYVYALFFIYSSLSAVIGVPPRESTTVIFGERPRAKIMTTSLSKGVFKEDDKSILCPGDILESKECPAITCAASICIADGVAKVCSASKALLVCIGILS